ncbi:MAG: glutamate--cysteine ligase [Pseudonocardiaceae bacterium]
MGEEVEERTFTHADRTRYRQKLRRCLEVFGQMLDEVRFDASRPLMGCEIELNLVDAQGDPAMRNAEVLDAISHPDFQTELGQFNVEINMPPRLLTGAALEELEDELRAYLNSADESARRVGVRLMMIGILPTIATDHLGADAITANPRYQLLNEQILAVRREDLRLEIDGVEQLRATADTVAPEAACTSVQFHLQVSPASFAAYWNAAQAVAGVQLAVGANSPYLFGRELWRETRIALFQQATDTRSDELKEQGVRPRVWFGDEWITSSFELFEENVRYFSALLPICDEEDPGEALQRGATPALAELRLHNGTVYRWNRPIYDVVDNVPHLRVENRVLPAGPTVADTLANAALYYGLVRVLAEDEQPIWSQMPFRAAEENFYAAARHGSAARLFWPDVGEVPATELVLHRLLPMAQEGLRRWEVDAKIRDRLLGIIEQRCLIATTGAQWQVETVHRLQKRWHCTRTEALRRMTLRYAEHMHSNQPVHTWPIDD